MNKTVVLELKGDLEQQGFYVTLHVTQDGMVFSTTEDGYLPPSFALSGSLAQWQEDYHRLVFPTRALKPYKLKLDGKIHPLEACLESAQQLAQQFASWLRSESFRDIELRLCQSLMPNDSIRVLIRTPNAQIQALPWHLWVLIEQYPKAEIVFVSSRSKISVHDHSFGRSKQPQVNILAVLGDSRNIDIERDRHLLNQLPGANIKFLPEPTHQEFHDYLYEQSWDILFFAGHSETETDGQGVIRLNSGTHLTVTEVNYAVKRAIANGLKLAIFNSCHGLGLAHALADLQLPHMIVMREAVPDLVAQQFLKFFLQSFAQKQPLHLAEREARERLQSMEKQYPCASWLPVIYQHPATLPLTWQELQGSDDDQQFPPVTVIDDEKEQFSVCVPKKQKTSLFSQFSTARRILIIGILSTLVMMGIRWGGLLQSWELQNYDQLLQWRSVELPDPRILLVGADEADLRTYGYPLPDHVLAKLIEKLTQSEPDAIGLDIYRDRSIPLGDKTLVSQFQANSNLVTACTFGSTDTEAIAPPPQSPLDQIGFVDLESDSSMTVRRHLLSHKLSSSSSCNTDYSFVLQLLFRYIDNSDGRFSIETTPQLDWQINDTVHNQSIVLRRLSARSGGYQNLDARGNQVLINYRMTPNIARQVSIQAILDGKIDSTWINKQVVLIGVVAPSIQDSHATPIGRLRGLQVHAQILSQFLSAIEDNRPLVAYLPQGVDFLFVFIWTLIGGMIVLTVCTRSLLQNKLPQVILVFTGIGTFVTLVYSLGWFALIRYGLWLPVIPTSLSLLTMGCYLILSLHKPAIPNH
jgi:CHASE2 domain-containing sensor protein